MLRFKFTKKVFVTVIQECMDILGIDENELARELRVNVKTVKAYLDVESPQLPKLDRYVDLFQILYTTASRPLIGRGPKAIDPSSVEKLYSVTERISDPKKPAYQEILSMILQLKYEDVERIAEHLELHVEHKRSLGELLEQDQ